MLTDIYSFFTGGFDRVDLLQAKALLDAWALSGGLNDRLLKDGRLAIGEVSATSAGAMNAVVLAYGMLQGDESVERHNPFEGDAQLRAGLYAHVEARAIHRTVGCRN